MIRPTKRPYTTWDSVPVVFNTRTAALLLNVDLKTVQRWAANGKIPAKKVDSTYLFEKSALMEFVGVSE